MNGTVVDGQNNQLESFLNEVGNTENDKEDKYQGIRNAIVCYNNLREVQDERYFFYHHLNVMLLIMSVYLFKYLAPCVYDFFNIVFSFAFWLASVFSRIPFNAEY